MDFPFLINVEPSPADDRDWVAEELYTGVNETGYIDYRKDHMPVRNQGGQGSCAAMAGAAMKEWQERQDLGIKDYLSPQYVYNLRSNKPGSGMYMRNLMKILSNYGIVREAIYPYGTNRKITVELKHSGINMAIRGYARVTTVEGMNIALRKNGPVIIAVPVYNYGKSMWKPEHPAQERVGGHAMEVCGRNSKGYIIRNSWGDAWGDKGYTIMPYEDFKYAWEIWTTIDSKSKQPDATTKLKIWWLKVKLFFQTKMHIWVPSLMGILFVTALLISVFNKK